MRDGGSGTIDEHSVRLARSVTARHIENGESINDPDARARTAARRPPAPSRSSHGRDVGRHVYRAPVGGTAAMARPTCRRRRRRRRRHHRRRAATAAASLPRLPLINKNQTPIAICGHTVTHHWSSHGMAPFVSRPVGYFIFIFFLPHL